MKRVLIIDDDADFRSAIAHMLGSSGYICEETATAMSGLKKAREYRPDLIVLDVMMEDISAGFRFAKSFRDDETANGRRRVPILVLSNVQRITDLKFGQRVGGDLFPADAFLDKPVEKEVLLNKVIDLLA